MLCNLSEGEYVRHDRLTEMAWCSGAWPSEGVRLCAQRQRWRVRSAAGIRVLSYNNLSTSVRNTTTGLMSALLTRVCWSVVECCQ